MTHPHPAPLPNGEGSSRVVKLGGSLLDLADLLPRLRDWLERQPPSSTVLVAGGGRMADVVRDADRLHRLGETVSHWLCIRVMTINAEMLSALLPEASLCRSLAEWRSLRVDEASCLVKTVDEAACHVPPVSLALPNNERGKMPRLLASPTDGCDRAPRRPDLAILDPWSFLREEEPQLDGLALPESWQVTSDSIAARFAQAIGAAELVLLKSALPDATWTLADAAAAGYVDACLPRIAHLTPMIRCVNLRAEGFPQSIWRHGSRDAALRTP